MFYTLKKKVKISKEEVKKIQSGNQTQTNPALCQINNISVLKDGEKVTQMTFEHNTLYIVST